FFMSTFADRAIQFHRKLNLSTPLPPKIASLNPYRDNPEIMQILRAFYAKFYADNHTRKLIVGINPGRLGAGVTGIPFTDTKRLQHDCGLTMNDSKETHEPSSVFIYELIAAYGGINAFYKQFFISSVCPLG